MERDWCRYYRPKKHRIKLSRRVRKMRSFQWRGFKVTLINNHAYSFRYEYRVEPLGPSSLRLTRTKRNRYYNRVIYDPTSMPRWRTSIEDGKQRVNELKSPFYLCPWHEG